MGGYISPYFDANITVIRMLIGGRLMNGHSDEAVDLRGLQSITGCNKKGLFLLHETPILSGGGGQMGDLLS